MWQVRVTSALDGALVSEFSLPQDTTTIGHVKAKVFQLCQIPMCEQRLVHCESVLSDDLYIYQLTPAVEVVGQIASLTLQLLRSKWIEVVDAPFADFVGEDGHLVVSRGTRVEVVHFEANPNGGYIFGRIIDKSNDPLSSIGWLPSSTFHLADARPSLFRLGATVALRDNIDTSGWTGYLRGDVGDECVILHVGAEIDDIGWLFVRKLCTRGRELGDDDAGDRLLCVVACENDHEV